MELNIILVSNDISSIMNTFINFNFCNVLIKIYKYPHIGICIVWIILVVSESLLSITPIVIWHVPKSLVKPKKGLSCSNSGIVRDSGHAPSSQH
jgi:hypothetical protein